MKNWWDIVDRQSLAGKPVLETRPTTIKIFYCKLVGFYETSDNKKIKNKKRKIMEGYMYKGIRVRAHAVIGVLKVCIYFLLNLFLLFY